MAEQERMTKNDRRQHAREQARLAREAERKREKRNRLLLQGGIVAAVLAILAIVAVVVASSLRPAGPGPANMASGGAVFGQDLAIVESEPLEPDQSRQAANAEFDKKPLPVTVYFDYTCPACGTFEQTYGDMLEQYTGSGDIQLELYPISFLDPQTSTRFSSRAGGAFACVVNEQPEHALAFHQQLFAPETQPAEGGIGLSDEELLETAELAGVELTDSFTSCVNDREFQSFIQANTRQVTEREVLEVRPGSQLYANIQTGQLQPEDAKQLLTSTPLVLVNGEQWNSAVDGDLEALILKHLQELDAAEAEAGSVE